MPYEVAWNFLPSASIPMFGQLLAGAGLCSVLSWLRLIKLLKENVLLGVLTISCNSRVYFSQYLCVHLLLRFDGLYSSVV